MSEGLKCFALYADNRRDLFMNETAAVHKWQFFSAGEFDQVLLRDGADLAALEGLDKKLWATLSCPVAGLQFDQRTLQLLDENTDGRIRVPEILAAIAYCRELLTDLDILIEGDQALPLELIDDSHDAGRQVRASAQRILASADKADASTITVDDVMSMLDRLAGMPFNGDGILPASAVTDDALREVVELIIHCIGGEEDRSGEQGIDDKKLEQFFALGRERLAWLQEAGEDQEKIRPLGEATAQAHALLLELQEKISDYFVRTRLAAYDGRTRALLNRSDEDYAALASRQLNPQDDELASFPLANISPDAALPLLQGTNPAWSQALSDFHAMVVVPLLGERAELSEQDWLHIQEKLAPYTAWLAAEQGKELAALDPQQLQDLLTGDACKKLEGLLAEDLAVKPEIDALEQVERLVRYVHDLATLLRNYVSFADFYSRKKKAIFQAGTLYLDQRSYELCIEVRDIEQHSALAPLSKTYLLYCECHRRADDEAMHVAVAVTDGDSGNLMVGRNGLFIDRDGRDWDASVVAIIEQPISVREAFTAPYRKLARFIGDQIAKMADAKAKAMDDSLAASVEGTAGAAEAGTAPPAAPFDIAKFAGIFAAIGLALGALGTAVAALVTGLLALAWWQLPLVLVGIMLVISGPSMVIAWLKLRQRNLAPLLDANGWAVNTRARINIPFGRSLTALASLPEGSVRSLRDPYAERKTPWTLYLLFLLAIIAGAGYWLWQQGWFAVAA